MFIYHAEVTSLISPREKPEAICKIPLIKKQVQTLFATCTHTRAHTNKYAHMQSERPSELVYTEESYLLSRLEHVWASVCETEPVHACWTAVRELSVVEASLIFELVISQGDSCYAGEHTRARSALKAFKSLSLSQITLEMSRASRMKECDRQGWRGRRLQNRAKQTQCFFFPSPS